MRWRQKQLKGIRFQHVPMRLILKFILCCMGWLHSSKWIWWGEEKKNKRDHIPHVPMCLILKFILCCMGWLHSPYSLKFSRPLKFRASIFRAPPKFRYFCASNFRASHPIRTPLIFVHPKILWKILFYWMWHDSCFKWHLGEPSHFAAFYGN